MISKLNKNEDRKKRHARVRLKVSGTAECPRLSVYRSLNHIYAQLIDDTKGVTLVACSTVEKDVMALVAEADKKGAANIVGKELAKKALAKGIEYVVFDRGGYLYTGRVASLADGAREAGLKF
ncbi:MAG: 50S ribosomal protein L18 [Clostridia bacterium]|nr:50S ribosomal protein L18 [Clostridia bacterium]